jgi:hypothetical protein
MVMSMIGVDVVVVEVGGVVVEVVRGGSDVVLDGVGVLDPRAGALVLVGAGVRVFVRDDVAEDVRPVAAESLEKFDPVGSLVCVVATGSWRAVAALAGMSAVKTTRLEAPPSHSKATAGTGCQRAPRVRATP